MSLFEYIIRVENTTRKRQSIEREEAELTRPIIADCSHMGDIYGIFADEIAKKNVKIDSIQSRRIFILIVMRLFCPSVFSGKKLKWGIRDEMARLLGCEASVISHDFKNLTFYYKKYKHFRTTVDEIYNTIMETISEK